MRIQLGNRRRDVSIRLVLQFEQVGLADLVESSGARTRAEEQGLREVPSARELSSLGEVAGTQVATPGVRFHKKYGCCDSGVYRDKKTVSQTQMAKIT
jgi:hypothetical protein